MMSRMFANDVVRRQIKNYYAALLARDPLSDEKPDMMPAINAVIRISTADEPFKGST